MERRDVLKCGLALGAFVVFERLPGPEPAEAAALIVRYYSGKITSGPARGWTIWIAVSGSGSRGFAFKPGTTDDNPKGYRLAGSFVGGKLKLSLFAVDDQFEQTPLGTLTGSLKEGAMVGTYKVTQGNKTGRFSAKNVPLNAAKMAKLAGTYNGTVRDGNDNPLYNATLVARANGSYDISNIQEVEGGPGFGTQGIPTHMTGKWGLGRDSRLYLCPTPFPFGEGTPCVERVLCCPPLAVAVLVLSGTALRLNHPFEDYYARGFPPE